MAQILGACFGVYILAFIFRGIINFVLSLSGREAGKRKKTYLAVGIAAIAAYAISGVGYGEWGSPDYSQSWIYLLAGVIVFVFEWWRLANREKEQEEAEEGR